MMDKITFLKSKIADLEECNINLAKENIYLRGKVIDLDEASFKLNVINRSMEIVKYAMVDIIRAVGYNCSTSDINIIPFDPPQKNSIKQWWEVEKVEVKMTIKCISGIAKIITNIVHRDFIDYKEKIKL